jgi:hypothetical protein
MDERPNLVTLNALTGKIAKGFVLIFGTGFAEIGQELHHSRAVNSRHPGRGAKRIALDQTGNYPSAFFGGDLVHKFKIAFMLERSSIICKDMAIKFGTFYTEKP